MSEEEHVRLSGTVRDLFAHRFVMHTGTGTVLADLGPDGAERVHLLVGDAITIEGVRKPSEVKVKRLTRGAEVIDLDDRHGKHEGKKHPPGAHSEIALMSLRKEGLVPVGQARRKHKHFEMLGRGADGALIELHVDLDGTVRKRKTIEADDDKWSEDIKDEP